MTTETHVASRYVKRVKLVQGIVKEHSQLGDEAASEIAVRVLHALDTIPEKVR